MCRGYRAFYASPPLSRSLVRANFADASPVDTITGLGFMLITMECDDFNSNVSTNEKFNIPTILYIRFFVKFSNARTFFQGSMKNLHC